MKLLYFVPGHMTGSGPPGQAEFNRRRQLLQKVALPGMEVEIEEYADGPASIESAAEEILAARGVLQAAVRAEKAGFDAMVVGCYSDPGVAGARELVRMLVVGPAESSLLQALLVGRRFAVITTLKTSIPAMREQVERMGLAHRCASVRAVDVPVLSVRSEADRVIAEFVREANRAVEEDGADVVVPGCMSLAFLFLEQPPRLEVPMVNPLQAALTSAYSLWVQGLGHSRRAYPQPPKAVPV